MPAFLVEIFGYYTTGWVAILEKCMIFFMVFWLIWCTKLCLEPDDGVEPILNEDKGVKANG